MIDASLVYEYVLDFPEEILAEGVTRKYVNTLLYGKFFFILLTQDLVVIPIEIFIPSVAPGGIPNQALV